MDYDGVLRHLGERGPWNARGHAVIWAIVFASGTVYLTYSFTGLQPSRFRCLIPECDSLSAHPSYEDVPELIFPPGDLDSEPDHCRYFPPRPGATCESASAFDLDAEPVECETEGGNFLYGDFRMDSTVVTEWDLVCDQQYKVALAGSTYMVGQVVGSVVAGFLADYAGRLPTLAIIALTGWTANLGAAFVESYEWYCFARFFAGVGCMGTVLTAFVLAVELSGDSTKTTISIGFQIPFAAGEVAVAALSYWVKDWRNFHIWISAPMFVLCLPLLFLPESPRWLLKCGRKDKFVSTVRRGAKLNKKMIPEHLLCPMTEKDPGLQQSSCVAERSESSQYSSLNLLPKGDRRTDRSGLANVSALFSSWTMTKVTLIMCSNWLLVIVGFNSISLGIGNVGSDVLANFMLVSLIEIPSYVAVILTMDHLGRKTVFVCSALLSGICCLVAAFLRDDVTKTDLSIVGKFGVAGGYAVLFLYTSELYPTEIRSTAVGICSTIGHIGAIAAPQIALYLPKLISKDFPLLLVGGHATLGGLLTLLLPETLGWPLVESVEDVRRMEDRGKSFFSWWSAERLREELEKNRSTGHNSA